MSNEQVVQDDDVFGMEQEVPAVAPRPVTEREVQQEGVISIKCGIAPGRVYQFNVPARSTVEQAIAGFVQTANQEDPNHPVNVDSMEVRLNGEVTTDYDQELTAGDKVHLTQNKKGA